MKDWDIAYIMLGEINNLAWVYNIDEAHRQWFFEAQWSEDRKWVLIKITKEQAQKLPIEIERISENTLTKTFIPIRLFRRIKTMAKRVWPDISLEPGAAMPESVIAYDTFLYGLGRGDEYVQHEVHDTTGKRIPPTPFSRN